MKASMFNIVQSYNKRILLYNTYTTAMIEMEEDLYVDIFENKSLKYVDEINSLKHMGFLINDDVDELMEQAKLRKTVISNSEEIISNIIIAPTLICNANCFYCFEKGYRKGIMNARTAKALVQFLKKHWNGEKIGITWFGGEPLLAADVIEVIIDELNKENIPFASKITTNGSLLTKDMIERIKRKWNVDKIQITVDALYEKYNLIKNYSGIDDAFSLIMDNIKQCLNEKMPIRIRINFDPDKMGDAVETMEYFNKHFGKYSNIKVYFAPIDDDGLVRSITDDFVEYDEHPYIKLIKYGREHNLYRGFPDMEDDESALKFDNNGLLKKLKIYPQPINCYATCRNVFSIDHNGNLYKCHRVLGRREYISGNVFDGVEKNATYNFFCDSEVVMEECNSCPILPICQGGCKINARLFNGKGCCAPSKTIIKQLVQLYREDLNKERGVDDGDN